MPINKIKTNRNINFLRKIFFSLLIGLLWTTTATAFDFSGWDLLIKKYVHPKKVDGILIHAVDYKELKDDQDFKKLITCSSFIHSK